LNAAIGANKYINSIFHYTEQSFSIFTLVYHKSIQVNQLANLNATTAIQMLPVIKLRDEMELQAAIHATKTIWLNEDRETSLNANIHASKVIWYNANVEEEMTHDVYLGKFIWFIKTWDEMLESVIDSVTVSYQDVFLDLDIPPGGELRIDSDYFNAILNKENVIHKYNGDWITLDRNAKQISIDGGGVPLYGEIIYTEKYL
jgi:hypothetical protein